MNYSLFDVLDFINFESGNIDWDDLCEINKNFRMNSQLRGEIWSSSQLIKTWWVLWKFTPSFRMADFIFSKLFGGHITIGDLTIFGCNAMMFAFQLHTKKGIWLFRPPCFNLYKHKFTWGRLYLSPDGTPRNPRARIYYGKNDY
ncbi:hypothetical protein [Nostoc piscinale]|nr:hypothetical protein [Nostoc piscinale]